MSNKPNQFIFSYRGNDGNRLTKEFRTEDGFTANNLVEQFNLFLDGLGIRPSNQTYQLPQVNNKPFGPISSSTDRTEAQKRIDEMMSNFKAKAVPVVGEFVEIPDDVQPIPEAAPVIEPYKLVLQADNLEPL